MVIWAACGFGGFAIPQLFDSDVGGALASEVFGIVGLVLGPVVALLALRSVERLTMISAVQVRAALALLDWTTTTLATRAVLSFDEIARAQDDIAIQHLGGLQRGAIREDLETAGVVFTAESGGAGVRLRKAGL